MSELETTRRSFLKAGVSTGLGLVLGFRWQTGRARAAAASFEPNAFLRIAPDNTVTVISKHLEMGQGTYTGLATVVAEELDAAWSQIRVESAPADASKYANLSWGGIQGTGGSSAMANSFDQLRKAGAAARSMLRDAAAKRWGVKARSLKIDQGVIRHDRTGRVASFGDLAAEAAGLPVPEDPPLKKPRDYRLIGKAGNTRVDARHKADGSARFTVDHHKDGMLTALVARPPRFGGKVKSFDASACSKVKGFVQAVQTSRGVAVLGLNYWAAKKSRDALKVEWDDSGAETRSSEEIFAAYRELSKTPGLKVHDDGDAAGALKKAAAVMEAVYEFPYLAHAPMEPLDAVIQLRGGVCDFWAGSQIQTLDQQVIARILGLTVGKVRVHTVYAGGSFGRRATPSSDVASEAAEILKVSGRKEPVRLMWTREDDLTGGYYRPTSLHRVRLGIDREGRPSGWEHRVVSQSILKGTLFEPYLVKNGIDHTSVEGVDVIPYGVTDRRLELHSPTSPVSVLWWRSVGHSTNGFIVETLIDELAAMSHSDPLDFRLELMKPDARERKVLERAAREAGWGRQLPPGKARGLSVHTSFGSCVAMVAEVSVGEGGLPRVHRVVCAVDCGRVLNPTIVEAQMQSGIGFGLGAALYNEVELEGGVPKATNFDTYRSIRIQDMPRVEVHTMASDKPPTGVGEPGVPPIAPAVANAWFQLTGRRVRRLPFARWRA